MTSSDENSETIAETAKVDDKIVTRERLYELVWTELSKLERSSNAHGQDGLDEELLGNLRTMRSEALRKLQSRWRRS